MDNIFDLKKHMMSIKIVLMIVASVVSIIVILLYMNQVSLNLFLLNHHAPFKQHRIFVNRLHKQQKYFERKFGGNLEYVLVNLDNEKSLILNENSFKNNSNSIASIAKLFIAKAYVENGGNMHDKNFMKMLCLSDKKAAQNLYPVVENRVLALLNEYHIKMGRSGIETVTQETNAMSTENLMLFLVEMAQYLNMNDKVLPTNALQPKCTAEQIQFNQEIAFAKTGTASFKGTITGKLLVIVFRNKHDGKSYLMIIRLHNEHGLCAKGKKCFSNVEFQELINITDDFLK